MGLEWAGIPGCFLSCGWSQRTARLPSVVRKNSIRARKTMEMLSFTSLVSSLPDCRNPGASCDPITIFLVRSAFLRTWVCAMLDHVSSCPLGFTLTRFYLSSRW